MVTTLRDLPTLEEYVSWLKDVHVKDVIKAGGALSAEVLIKGDLSIYSRGIFEFEGLGCGKSFHMCTSV